MIKLNVVGGTIQSVECSTAEEAVDFARKFDGNLNGGLYSPHMTPARMAAQVSGQIPENSDVIQFINKLNNLKVTVVGSGDLAQALGVSGIQGLGPKIRGFGRKFEEMYGRQIVELINREDTAPGEHSTWHINRDTLKKMGFS